MFDAFIRERYVDLDPSVLAKLNQLRIAQMKAYADALRVRMATPIRLTPAMRRYLWWHRLARRWRAFEVVW